MSGLAGLLGLAVLVMPRPRDRRDGGGDTAPAGPRRWPLVVALLLLAGACVALFGPVGGAAAAMLACPLAAVALGRLQRRPPSRAPTRSLALTLDLCAAALRAGQPPRDALAAVADVADRETRDVLVGVAGLLRLGADARQAWSSVDPDGPLGPVAAAAVRSAASGIRSAAAFERLADDIRADAAAAAVAGAHRAGVVAMAPLGACFLPSFVCLGIVPVVVGIAGSTLGVLH